MRTIRQPNEVESGARADCKGVGAPCTFQHENLRRQHPVHVADLCAARQMREKLVDRRCSPAQQATAQDHLEVDSVLCNSHAQYGVLRQVRLMLTGHLRHKLPLYSLRCCI